MHPEPMTTHEWGTHVERSLRLEFGMIMHVGEQPDTWMWFDHERPDVAALLALYRRTKDIASLITLRYAPTSIAGIYDIHVEVLYPPAPVSYSLLIPDIADNVPFLDHVATTGRLTVITEQAPEDWQIWRRQRGITTDAAAIQAIVTTYGPQGFVVEIDHDAQEVLRRMMDAPRPIGG